MHEAAAVEMNAPISRGLLHPFAIDHYAGGVFVEMNAPISRGLLLETIYAIATPVMQLK